MNYKKTLLTLISALFLFTAFVICKNCFTSMLPNSAMGVQSVIGQKHLDTLFLGSSAYRKGVDMYAMEKELPGNSFMLTYNGNQPFNMAIELNEILQSGTSIDRLVVDFNPSMADRQADLSDKRLIFDISFHGKRRLWKELAKNEDTTFFTFYDFFVLSNNDYLFTYPVSYPLISSRYYRGGGTNSDETEGKTEEELMELEVIEQPGIHALQLQSIDEIIQLCKENNISLIFLESPRYIKMAENENYQAKSDELYSHITKQDIPVYRTSDLHFDNKNPAFYSDLTHMSKEGKQEFTDCILRVLRRN